MKRRIIFFVVTVSMALFLLGSCKSTSHCPAYSQADVEQAPENV